MKLPGDATAADAFKDAEPFAGLQRALDDGRLAVTPDSVRIRRFIRGFRSDGPPAAIREALIRRFMS
jgi:hypothetical protein